MPTNIETQRQIASLKALLLDHHTRSLVRDLSALSPAVRAPLLLGVFATLLYYGFSLGTLADLGRALVSDLPEETLNGYLAWCDAFDTALAAARDDGGQPDAA